MRRQIIRNSLTLIIAAFALFAAAPAALANCSNPAGAASDTIYNPSANVMQYCNGTNWIAMGPSGPAGGSTGPTAGLVAHWKLDETSGTTIADSTGNGHIGTWLGVPTASVTPTVGAVDGALHFDRPEKDYVSIPYAAALDITSTGGTISAWFVSDVAQVGQDSKWAIYWRPWHGNLANTAGLGLVLYQGCSTCNMYLAGQFASTLIASSLTPITSGTLYHAAVTWDATTVHLYLNGQEELSAAQPGYSYIDNMGPWIGRANTTGGGGTQYAAGFIDDVRVYNRLLTPAEIQDLYNTRTVCADPIAAPGGLRYNRAPHQMQFCSRRTWMAMAPPGPGPVAVSSSGPANLIAHWKLDEVGTATTAADGAGSNHGTLTNFTFNSDPPVWQPAGGKFGGALSLDGVGNYVTSGPVFAALGTSNQPYSLSAWINAGAGETLADILHVSALSDGGGWCVPMLTLSASKIVSNSWTGGLSSVTSNATITPGQWYHVVTTWDATNGLRIYIDGALDNSTPQATFSASGNSNYLFAGFSKGSCANTTSSYFKGLIDDVRVYDKALSAAEVSNLFTAASEPSNLVARWQLDESSGFTATDSAGAKHGTLYPQKGTWAADGILAGRLSFIGDNDYILIPDAAAWDQSDDLTVSLWVKPGLMEAADPLVARWNEAGNKRVWVIAIDDATGKIIFYTSSTGVNESSVLSISQISATNWTHITAVHNSTTGQNKLFINGKLNNVTGSVPAALFDTDEPVMIGHAARFSNGTGRYFQGLIDDVRIFDRALTDQEVTDLYGIRGLCANPSRSEGTMLFNTNSNVMQYCNGTDWRRIGK